MTSKKRIKKNSSKTKKDLRRFRKKLLKDSRNTENDFNIRSYLF